MRGEDRLHVSLDGVVALRSVNPGRHPDPVSVGLLAELAGVDYVALALGDRRARRERDVHLLRDGLGARLDLVMAPSGDVVTTAFDVRPDRVTLAPDPREGSGGTLDAHLLKDALRKHVSHLKDAEIEVGVRIEPALDQVKALHRIGASIAVLDVGGYLQARNASEIRNELSRISDAATLASRLELRVAVGGGVQLRSAEVLARIAPIGEFQIGHALLSRALLRGIDRAVSDFVAAIERGRRRAF